MQGSHTFQPELFMQIDYEKVIPQTHLLRRIAKVLDLGFIKKSTKIFYSNSQGRPSIDPEVFFRICILGHIYGIKSDRQLCEEIEMNIAYRWFVGLSFNDAVADHSSLSRVITDYNVTTGACHESTVITERIEYQQKRFGLPIEELIADAGYGSGKNYKFFEEHKMRIYIPMAKRRRDGKQREYEDSFKYDKEQDIYECQAGHALYQRHAAATKYYHIKKVHCKSCQWRSDCYLGNRYTGIYRNEYEESIERVRRRQTSWLFKQRMKERSWKIEGLFGEAKERHGLRRAKYRSSEKMQIQAYLTGITQNLKRLAASLDFYFHWIRFWFAQRFLLLRHSLRG